MDRKTIIYYLKEVLDSKPERLTRQRKAIEEALNYIITWVVVLADLKFELDKYKKIPGEDDYCLGLGFAIDIMNDDLELEKKDNRNEK
ncbi:hypothetical protein [uncultured Eubacterium sp.]|uniref:hypothetical protein n=1 Tax=uncultured Eubacterium sp. TaxID=165185 RepID=UPI0025979DAC|nr:hypothetical protein [uncultured Eubacterium sp.]